MVWVGLVTTSKLLNSSSSPHQRKLCTEGPTYLMYAGENTVHMYKLVLDSSSTSLGIGLSIALKAERGIPDWLWGAVAQWSEHLQLKQEALGSIPSGCPGFFLFQLAYTNVNGMKDLWCSSTVRLLSTQI